MGEKVTDFYRGQRGDVPSKYLYKENTKHAFEFKPCLWCDDFTYIDRRGDYCSGSCAALARKARGDSNFFALQLRNIDISEYKSLHRRLARERGKASFCVNGCNNGTRYEWANLTGNYRDFDDYQQMCKRCHSLFDLARIKEKMWGEK